MFKPVQGCKVVNEYYHEDPINHVKGYFMVDLGEMLEKEKEEISKVLLDFSRDRGHFNGYVALCENHPDYGKDYDDIDVEVHGGLTFSQEVEYQNEKYWVVGFDTAHLNDTSKYWTRERTLEEVHKLYQQMIFKDND